MSQQRALRRERSPGLSWAGSCQQVKGGGPQAEFIM